MGKRRQGAVTAIAVATVAGVAVGGCAPIEQHERRPGTSSPTTSVAPTQRCTVTWVSDGDTFRCRTASGQDMGRVRIVGVDAPEVRHEGRSAECFGDAATEQLRRLVDRQQVSLTTDPTQGERDRYGRRLAYVSTDEVPDVGLRLLRAGGASVTSFRYERREAYGQAERAARESRAGLWGACGTGSR